MAKRQSIADRFWSKVGIPDEGGCRAWLAHRDKNGYGTFELCRDGKGYPVRAHAFAWRLTYHGPTLPHPVFRHSCDHPWCAEPSHAYPGTHAENVADRVARGRGAFGLRNGAYTHPENRPRGDTHYSRTRPELLRSPKGEQNGRSKITSEKALRIRAANGTQASIAALEGVSQMLVSLIKRRKLWKHLS